MGLKLWDSISGKRHETKKNQMGSLPRICHQRTYIKRHQGRAGNHLGIFKASLIHRSDLSQANSMLKARQKLRLGPSIDRGRG
jgi:hypothetical protein